MPTPNAARRCIFSDNEANTSFREDFYYRTSVWSQTDKDTDVASRFRVIPVPSTGF